MAPFKPDLCHLVVVAYGYLVASIELAKIEVVSACCWAWLAKRVCD
jgi:hypothetical protein